jgi:hypothetical protein
MAARSVTHAELNQYLRVDGGLGLLNGHLLDLLNWRA